MGVVISNLIALVDHVEGTRKTINSYVRQIKSAHSKSAHVRFECKMIDVITSVHDVMKMVTCMNMESTKMVNVLGDLRDRDNKYWVDSVYVKTDSK